MKGLFRPLRGDTEACCRGWCPLRKGAVCLQGQSLGRQEAHPRRGLSVTWISLMTPSLVLSASMARLPLDSLPLLARTQDKQPGGEPRLSRP